MGATLREIIAAAKIDQQLQHRKYLSISGKMYRVIISNYDDAPMLMRIDLICGDFEKTISYNPGGFAGPGAYVERGYCILEDHIDVRKALEKEGLAKRVCGFPFPDEEKSLKKIVYRFILDKLKEYDSDGVKCYEEKWAAAIVSSHIPFINN